MDATSKQELTIRGMTYGHCVRSLITTLGVRSGVEAVDVNVNSGQAIPRTVHVVSSDALSEAVSEASFELTAVRERAR